MPHVPADRPAANADADADRAHPLRRHALGEPLSLRRWQFDPAKILEHFTGQEAKVHEFTRGLVFGRQPG